MAISSINSGISSPLLSSQSDLLQARPPAKVTSQPRAVVARNDGAATNEEKRQSALHLVTRTLTQAYEKIANRGTAPAAAYNDQGPMTATKAASTILGFIERRLQLDAAEGATQEQLQSRLEAGLEGFKKGFAEAAEKLKALSMLSPEIAADIDDTYKQVMSGLDALRVKFIKDAAPKTNDRPAAVALDRPTQINNIAIQKGLYEYAEARDFRFELTTKEGDKVSIRASSSVGVSMAAGRDASGIYGSASQSSASSFELSIEGDLNESELKAINQLMGRIDKLAGQFYAGNLDEAFNNAVALGYDDQQIAGYSLNLSQVQIQQVAVAYGAFAPESEMQVPDLANRLAPVGNFIKDVFESLDLASTFVDSQKLLLDLSQKMADKAGSENAQPSTFAQFLERILAAHTEKTEKVA